MPDTVTNEIVRELAGANGLEIPPERLEAVRKDYENLLLLIERLDSFPLGMATEPAIAFSPVAELPGGKPSLR